MRLNLKGQVTIPAELRHRYGFAPGDEVEVVDEDGVLRIVHGDGLTVGQRAVLRGVQRSRELGGPSMTTDAVMELTRGE